MNAIDEMRLVIALLGHHRPRPLVERRFQVIAGDKVLSDEELARVFDHSPYRRKIMIKDVGGGDPA